MYERINQIYKINEMKKNLSLCENTSFLFNYKKIDRRVKVKPNLNNLLETNIIPKKLNYFNDSKSKMYNTNLFPLNTETTFDKQNKFNNQINTFKKINFNTNKSHINYIKTEANRTFLDRFNKKIDIKSKLDSFYKENRKIRIKDKYNNKFNYLNNTNYCIGKEKQNIKTNSINKSFSNTNYIYLKLFYNKSTQDTSLKKINNNLSNFARIKKGNNYSKIKLKHKMFDKILDFSFFKKDIGKENNRNNHSINKKAFKYKKLNIFNEYNNFNESIILKNSQIARNSKKISLIKKTISKLNFCKNNDDSIDINNIDDSSILNDNVKNCEF